MAIDRNDELILGANLKEFFQGQVSTAIANQKVDVTEDAAYYVVNLLASFTRSETLYEQTPDGLMVRPLADFYADACAAATPEDRNQALRRLGDVALFIAGVFTGSLNRKLVDIDYYIAMGGNAYSFLSDSSARGKSPWRMLSAVFDELATKFVHFVDVLGEVSEKSQTKTDTDILRLYEVWVRTGSKRTARRLRQLGIHPTAGSVSRRCH